MSAIKNEKVSEQVALQRLKNPRIGVLKKLIKSGVLA